ncbi:MAG TPA: hypothetical protein VGD67_01110 [Pseudonocardiaceae bacterium]
MTGRSVLGSGLRPAVALAGAVLIGCVAVVCMSFFGGVAYFWSALLGVPVTLFAFMVLLSPTGVEPVWAPLPEAPGRATEHSAASLASRLSEAHDNPARFRSRLQRRLAALALAKLRRAGIEELHDPRAAGVLGPQLLQLVTAADAALPDPTTTAALIARLEED